MCTMLRISVEYALTDYSDGNGYAKSQDNMQKGETNDNRSNCFSVIRYVQKKNVEKCTLTSYRFCYERPQKDNWLQQKTSLEI